MLPGTSFALITLMGIWFLRCIFFFYFLVGDFSADAFPPPPPFWFARRSSGPELVLGRLPVTFWIKWSGIGDFSRVGFSSSLFVTWSDSLPFSTFSVVSLQKRVFFVPKGLTLVNQAPVTCLFLIFPLFDTCALCYRVGSVRLFPPPPPFSFFCSLFYRVPYR